ncbi:MAG: glycosyltransferase [Sphingomonas fennica]
MAVCIPARNEAAALPALLAGLACQTRPVAICLFLDDCRDGSAALLAAAAPGLPHPLHVAQGPATPGANAGRARAAAMALGEAALGPAPGLLLTTDADSVPAPGWAAAMAEGLAAADVVAGRIRRRGTRPAPLQDRIEAYYDRLFTLRRRIDPVPWEAAATHHHSGGANLGFRSAAYRAAGGFAPLAAGEDARIVDDAARAGLRVRRDAAAVVVTSDRRQGRAAGGLATALAALDGEGPAAVTVAHPADAAWQYRMHAAARSAWAEGAPARIAAAIGLTAAHAIGVARDCPNAEAFAMRVVPVPPGGMRQVPLPVAEALLTALHPAAAPVAA